MRIISGSRRGMKLLSPKGDSTRPITDRVKESIYSILVNRYSMPCDCLVADVFSGTGSFGMEALSRGASHVTFVEMDRKVVELLNRNIEKADFVEQSKVVRGNAFKVAAPLLPGQEKYDLIFVDPPYPLTFETDLKSKLGKMLMVVNEQVKADGLVLVRTHCKSVLLERYGNLKVLDRREWGNMAETFLQLENDQQESLDDSNLVEGDDACE